MLVLPADVDYAGLRLRLINSRVIKPGQPDPHNSTHDDRREPRHSSDSHGDREELIHEHDKYHGHRGELDPYDSPEFSRAHSASNFELFYDLWFIANLNVFTSIHEITQAHDLSTFVAYISLLWTTWLMVTIYDVRFTADSIMERCCRAVHLGVMVGFAEIGTSFDPNDQIGAVYQTMSLFLAFSRFALFLQYLVVAWSVRMYNEGMKPLLATSALNFVASMVYLGISFRYDRDGSSVYIVWYIGAILEMVFHLSFSQLNRVLTFVGTHFGERMNLLTLIILGEGCIILTKNVTLIVKDTYLKGDDMIWSSQLIGVVTACVALIYIIFQLYYDWMHAEQGRSMYEAHQVWWAALHLPFHVALILLLEGVSQFVLWARILEAVQGTTRKLLDIQDKLPDVPTTEEVVEALNGTVYPFLDKYKPVDVFKTYDSVRSALDDIGKIDDDFWEMDIQSDSKEWEAWVEDLTELLSAMINAIFNAFDITVPEEEQANFSSQNSEEMELQYTKSITDRFGMIFIYSYVAAGLVLGWLTIMHVISKRKGWTPFNLFRTLVCICLSLMLGLVSLLSLRPIAVDDFLGSAWMLPVITIVYFLVLVMSHIPHPPDFGLGKYKHLAKNTEIYQMGRRTMTGLGDAVVRRSTTVARRSTTLARRSTMLFSGGGGRQSQHDMGPDVERKAGLHGMMPLDEVSPPPPVPRIPADAEERFSRNIAGGAGYTNEQQRASTTSGMLPYPTDQHHHQGEAARGPLSPEAAAAGHGMPMVEMPRSPSTSSAAAARGAGRPTFLPYKEDSSSSSEGEGSERGRSRSRPGGVGGVMAPSPYASRSPSPDGGRTETYDSLGQGYWDRRG